MYKILAAVAICTLTWVMSGCENKEDTGSVWVDEPTSKSDTVDDVDPYEPITYLDLDMDFSGMSQEEYFEFLELFWASIDCVTTYSDHLFSDDAVDTKFSAAGGDKLIIPERGCVFPDFKWATSYDLMNDDSFKKDVKDWDGNPCFSVGFGVIEYVYEKLPLQSGDVVCVPEHTPGSYDWWLYGQVYDYLDSHGIERVNKECLYYPTNKILTFNTGIDKWLEVLMDGRRRTITLKASPNNTGVKRIVTIVFSHRIHRRCKKDGSIVEYAPGYDYPYLNNAIRVEQAAE